MKNAPALEVDGVLMSYKDAIKFINEKVNKWKTILLLTKNM
jgi:hypothetical protein